MREPCRSCSDKEPTSAAVVAAFLLTGDAANTDPACSRRRTIT